MLVTWFPLTRAGNLVYSTKVHFSANVTLGRDLSIVACEKLVSVPMGLQVCFNAAKCCGNTCFLVCIIGYLL